MQSSSDPRPLVFVDTNVLIGYLRGSLPEARLFSEAMLERFRFAINGTVASELLLSREGQTYATELQQLQDKVEILPISQANLLLMMSRIGPLRKREFHSNDILILSSAADCDYLLTQDQAFKALSDTDRPVILTTEEFLHTAEHR
jgi:predicted nucleic acid-binding protein